MKDVDQKLADMSPAEVEAFLLNDEAFEGGPLVDPEQDPLLSGTSGSVTPVPVLFSSGDDAMDTGSQKDENEDVSVGRVEKPDTETIYVREIIQVKNYCQATRDLVVSLEKAVTQLTRKLEGRSQDSEKVNGGGPIRVLKRPSDSQHDKHLVPSFNFAEPLKEENRGPSTSGVVRTARGSHQPVVTKDWDANLFVGNVPRKTRKEDENVVETSVSGPPREDDSGFRRRHTTGRGAIRGRGGRSYDRYNNVSSIASNTGHADTPSIVTVDCPLCERRHAGNWCPCSENLDEKKGIILRRGLCYRCLGKHHHRNCTASSVCAHCQAYPHHTFICPLYHCEFGPKRLDKGSDGKTGKCLLLL